MPSTELLAALAGAIADGGVQVVDLSQRLGPSIPIIQLPPPFAPTRPFSLETISAYDERGPAWYWNDIQTGEHVGTHFDAPIHWVTGKSGRDVSQVPARELIAPAVVVDQSARCANNPDYLLEVEDLKAWQREHGPLPRGGWLLYRTGWDSRAHDEASFLNANATGPPAARCGSARGRPSTCGVRRSSGGRRPDRSAASRSRTP